MVHPGFSPSFAGRAPVLYPETRFAQSDPVRTSIGRRPGRTVHRHPPGFRCSPDVAGTATPTSTTGTRRRWNLLNVYHFGRGPVAHHAAGTGTAHPNLRRGCGPPRAGGRWGRRRRCLGRLRDHRRPHRRRRSLPAVRDSEPVPVDGPTRGRWRAPDGRRRPRGTRRGTARAPQRAIPAMTSRAPRCRPRPRSSFGPRRSGTRLGPEADPVPPTRSAGFVDFPSVHTSRAPQDPPGGARSSSRLTQFGTGPQRTPALPATPIVTYWPTCFGW